MATSPVLFVYYPPLNDDSWPGVPGRHITEADWASFTIAQRRTVENATTQEGYTRRKVWVHRDLVDETEEERAQREAAEAAARAEYDRKNSLVRYGQIETMIDQLEVLPPAEEFAALRADVDAVADVPPRVDAVETALTGKADAAAVTALEGTVSTVQVQTDVLAALRFDPASPSYGAVRGSVSAAQRTANTAAINAAADDARDNDGVLVIKGEYETDGTLRFQCHVEATDATIRVFDQALAPAILVGGTTSGTDRITNKSVRLPAVLQSGKTGLGWPGTDVGVEIANAYYCQVTIPHIKHFSTNLRISAYSTGNVYNHYFLGLLENGKINLHVEPANATGWTNQNIFYLGRPSVQSTEGSAIPGTRGVLIGNGTNPVNTNIFLGIAPEGDGPEFHFEIYGSYNKFILARPENKSGPARIRFNGTNAFANEFEGGYAMDSVQWTYVNGAGSAWNKWKTRNGEWMPGSGDSGAVLVWNQTGDGSPSIVGLSADARFDTNPATDYVWTLRGQRLTGKRKADAHPRAILDFFNGSLSLDNGAQAPRHTVSAVGSFGMATNAMWRVGSVASLPTPSSFYRGMTVRVEGGAGVADETYQCRKTAADTYEWVKLTP